MPSEKILDRAIEESLKSDAAFCRWFLAKTKLGLNYTNCVWSRSNHPWGKVKLLLPNKDTGAIEMVAREGETDVLVVFENSAKRRLGIHIENKLERGHFTLHQPEVCAARADFWLHNSDYGNYDEWETLLLAPKSFYERNTNEARKFTTFIAHEEIAAHIPSFGFALKDA